VPALLTLVIRLFVDESEKWAKGKAEGKASFWSERDLLGVLLGCAAAGGVIALWGWEAGALPVWVRVAGSIVGLALVLYGYLVPARGYLSRCGFTPEVKRESLRRMLLAAGLSGVPLLATWAGLMWMYQWVGELPGGKNPDAKPWIQVSSSIGAALGCLVGAVLGGVFGRRPVYAALCILSGITMVGFYRLNTEYGLAFILSAGLLGFVSAAFYGWLPLYLPELFRTSMRATGQGFGFNFGRIIAAAANLQMANLLAAFDNNYSHACAIVAAIYVAGLALIAVSPETKGQPLPE
jgi:MFS transporter, SHS family, sialic acid transporter